MTPAEFIAKWKNGGDERRDSQPFFEDLCRLIGHQTPREADPEHSFFTYEYGAAKTSGGNGWADVWKKGFFGWEFKGTHKDLVAAYAQLKNYSDALENPPLLIVSDLERIIIHTNFTNTVKKDYEFTIYDLDKLETRQLLEAAFRDPEKLKPGITRAVVTKEAADKFSALALSLRSRGSDPHQVAHFLNRLLFCMFAEDIGLLPGQLFTKLVERSKDDPAIFEKRTRELFAVMHKGGDLAFENIAWFNGGLFDNDAALPLTKEDLRLLAETCRLDWSEIEPSIFGTLFERGLDPDKRTQLGAHYTDPETILKIVRPVVIEPWLQEWAEEKAALEKQLGKATKSVSKAASDRFNRFLERLRSFIVLDPACGSGNFLYLALRALKDVEKRILIEAEALGLPRQFPEIGPRSVRGIEINDYAAELARVTIWIGEIQWTISNGFTVKKDPVLQPLQQIETRDALLKPDETEAAWPDADVVIGNPPFLGDKKMIGSMGEHYVTTLRRIYSGLVPGGADLVCYWFAKAGELAAAGKLKRAGLVATQGIRGGKNRKVLADICDKGRIFNAWSDEPWVNEGASVRVSLVCFSSKVSTALLNGKAVDAVNADLTADAGFNLTKALPLAENAGVAFSGITKKGSFDIDGAKAREMMREAGNPNGRPNSDVVAPWKNGESIVDRDPDKWIVNFGERSEADASAYAAPFAHVTSDVKPARMTTKAKGERDNWWKLARRANDMFEAIGEKQRFIATPEVSKHRIVVWLTRGTVPDKNLVVIAKDDDTVFGILHSRLHQVWALRVGTKLEDRPRYTSSTTFRTFPFPDGLTPDLAATTYAKDPRAKRIADAARKLVEAREKWLNPPEWTDRVPEVVSGLPDRVVAKSGHEADLKKRTLTNLYNQRPAWLDNLHKELDAAVAAAYGWEWPLSDDEVLQRLFALNQARAAKSKPET